MPMLQKHKQRQTFSLEIIGTRELEKKGMVL